MPVWMSSIARSGRDSARAQLDHEFQAKCCNDAPERGEAWRVAARFEAGNSGLPAADSGSKFCLRDADVLSCLARSFREREGLLLGFR